jgi:hypothetical protein
MGNFSCGGVSQVQVTDARTDKTLGVRTHESKPLKADVSAGGDAVAWVHDGVQTYLGQNGLDARASGPQLLVSLEKVCTSESIWHRSGYQAHVFLSAQLQGPAGKACWKGSAEGVGDNYGYAGSVVNYQETLNSALDAATLNLAESPGFGAALCHCDSPASAQR